MVVKTIDKVLCNDCSWRKGEGCKVIDSCPTDVLRQAEDGYPRVAYPHDCMNCFLCANDCPAGAIQISPVASFPILAYPPPKPA